MQNLLIIDNDISYIENIINNVSESIPNIKLYSFYTTKNPKIYTCIQNNNVDIIILNFNKFQNFLKFISQNNIDFYKKSIFILYDDIEKLKKSEIKKYDKYIFKYIKRTKNIDILLEQLNVLTLKKENNYDELIIETKLKRILENIGFKYKHCGTKYIIEAIKYLYINHVEVFKLNNIFNYLSDKYNKPPNTIKGDIREATKYMYVNYNKNYLINFFNYIELVRLPTVSEIISTILEQM